MVRQINRDAHTIHISLTNEYLYPHSHQSPLRQYAGNRRTYEDESVRTVCLTNIYRVCSENATSLCQTLPASTNTRCKYIKQFFSQVISRSHACIGMHAVVPVKMHAAQAIHNTIPGTCSQSLGLNQRGD